MKYNSKYSKILTKKFLYKEYITNNRTAISIAKDIGCNSVTIRNYLIKFGIKIKTMSEMRKGKNNGNWKDGARSKIYYCIEKGCNKIISRITGRYGQGRCQKHASKYMWKNKKYREKVIKATFEAQKISPNKPEKLLIKLLKNLLPKTYTFVGAGQLIISGFCPDFVNKDNNKIIELFGCYWHKCQECGFGNGRTKDIGRLKEYKKAGYKVLIIWEHELEDIDKVKNKILDFNKNMEEK